MSNNKASNKSIQNTFKITANGFIKIYKDGVISTLFYHEGDEKHFIEDGYQQVF